LKEFDINGKVLFFIVFFVIAISSVFFSTTIVGTSGSSAVPNYNDKVVVATTTSFIADVSNGYTESDGKSSSGSSSGSSSNLQSIYDKKQQSAHDSVNRGMEHYRSLINKMPGSRTGPPSPPNMP